jgi:hypothetical protein
LIAAVRYSTAVMVRYQPITVKPRFDPKPFLLGFAVGRFDSEYLPVFHQCCIFICHSSTLKRCDHRHITDDLSNGYKIVGSKL